MACITPFSSSRLFSSSRSARSLVVTHAKSALPKQFKSVTPIGERVLVRVDKAEARTIGGVLLPSSQQKQSTAGEVISVGDATLKVGDRVIYSKFAGTDIEISGRNHVLMKEEEIIGKLAPGDKIKEMTPMEDRILIEKAKADEQSAGGVLLSSESTEKPTYGVIIAVGAGKKKEDSDEVEKVAFSAGQLVMYSKYSGTEFEEDDASFIVVREDEVLAALE